MGHRHRGARSAAESPGLKEVLDVVTNVHRVTCQSSLSKAGGGCGISLRGKKTVGKNPHSREDGEQWSLCSWVSVVSGLTGRRE